MKILEINSARWTGVIDAFESFMAALQAPDWHGRNLNALRDSITGNDLNGVRAPFEIRIFGKPNEDVAEFLKHVEEIFEEARQYGVDVQLSYAHADGF